MCLIELNNSTNITCYYYKHQDKASRANISNVRKFTCRLKEGAYTHIQLIFGTPDLLIFSIKRVFEISEYIILALRKKFFINVKETYVVLSVYKIWSNFYRNT